mmetsp:Transcript_23273/g.69668  ORF Transcript_23273/g.69668 Transcript_23273/m.69668 type:complete len:294 (+) Transcript_23273:440-1321(+)
MRQHVRHLGLSVGRFRCHVASLIGAGRARLQSLQQAVVEHHPEVARRARPAAFPKSFPVAGADGVAQPAVGGVAPQAELLLELPERQVPRVHHGAGNLVEVEQLKTELALAPRDVKDPRALRKLLHAKLVQQPAAEDARPAQSAEEGLRLRCSGSVRLSVQRVLEDAAGAVEASAAPGPPGAGWPHQACAAAAAESPRGASDVAPAEGRWRGGAAGRRLLARAGLWSHRPDLGTHGDRAGAERAGALLPGEGPPSVLRLCSVLLRLQRQASCGGLPVRCGRSTDRRHGMAADA